MAYIKTKKTVEPKKTTTKIKVSKTSPAKPTAAELEAANKFAKDFALRKGLMSGENTTVGNAVPKFIDSRTGKESAPIGTVAPVGMLSNKVPAEITKLEWDAESNLPYYIDPKTGDSKYVEQSLFHLPRFRRSSAVENPLGNPIVKR